jgi:dTDP-4-dehydrorhamnose 3,5-epimerase
MNVLDTPIPGHLIFEPTQHGDERGLFYEWFTQQAMRGSAGREFPVAQTNCSVSHRGTLRGMHFRALPPGQAKYVTCVRGAAFDVAVDIRLGAPTFGQWAGCVLDDTHRRAVWLNEGLAHGFLALADDTTMLYLCSEPYTPDEEYEIDPLDPAIGIDWPTLGRDGEPLQYVQSAKDSRGRTLAEAERAGLLPSWDEYRRLISGPQAQ